MGQADADNADGASADAPAPPDGAVPADARSVDATSDGATETGTGLDCSATGNQLMMRGDFEATSTNLRFIRGGFLAGGPGPIDGFVGDAVRGGGLILFRNGDVSDGNLHENRTYDVSKYPYNMVFETHANPVEDCWKDSGPECGVFIAQGGWFKVSQVSPVYKATFHFESLHSRPDIGPSIKGQVDGCIEMNGPATPDVPVDGCPACASNQVCVLPGYLKADYYSGKCEDIPAQCQAQDSADPGLCYKCIWQALCAGNTDCGYSHKSGNDGYCTGGI